MNRCLIALNAESKRSALRSALNVELPDDGKAPDWVELIPAGPTVRGNDGRSWTFGEAEAQAVMSAFNTHLKEIVMDWEHASEHRATQGLDAPASGWVKELDLRDGALWGRIDWTDKARNQVESKEYRYLSPVFLYTADDSRRIQRLTSVGLTNQPNFALKALNQEDPNLTEGDQPPMLLEKLIKLLGLSEDATEEQVFAALESMKASNQDMELKMAQNREATPSLDKFVPRTDFDKAVARATNAEHKLTQIQEKKQEADIEAAIDKALEQGKITPAAVDYHKAQCRSEGGLERFQKYVEQAPEVAGDSELDGKPPTGTSKALNAEMKAVAAQFGNSEEDLKKFGGLQ